MAEALSETFDLLKPMLSKHASQLVCVADEPGKYYLDTAYIMKNRKPLFFGAVQIKKRYVSFHLMPVYVFPELLDGLSHGLKARMHGKSCFNFRIPDPALFEELGRLVQVSLGRYREAGYLD